jgi:low molecular weight protein-tyrosine phosphatase
LAEAFVRRLTLGLPVATESYGTLELEGTPALPEAVELARACGVDIGDHRSRWLGDASLGEIDLVVGFEEAHIRAAVVEAGAQRSHSFTFRHLARVLAALSDIPDEEAVTRARAAVRQADELRSSELPASIADNMRDPLGAPWKVQRETALEIHRLSQELVATLFRVTDNSGLPPLPAKLRRGSPLRRRLRLG